MGRPEQPCPTHDALVAEWARTRPAHNPYAALLVEPCVVESLCVELVDSELGVDVAGFLGLKNFWTLSASCVKAFFFLGVEVLVVSGVTLLPSSVTVASVGPELVRVEIGGSVVVDSEPDGSCPCVVSVVSAGFGSLFVTDCCF